MQEIKKLSKWRNVLCLGMGRPSIGKMSVLPNLIYIQYNPSKNPIIL
jgi:hypothetical protein